VYIPAAFAETDVPTLHAFIRRHGFGLLVSTIDGIPFATHVPLLLEPGPAPLGSLIGHVARANPHWQHLGAQPALAVFSGPHVYVSPSWYESANVVPTWNYTAVHVYGRAQVIDDRAGVLALVQELVKVYESDRTPPWSLEADTTFMDRMLGQIVGFRIAIERIEGKWKLNQNHPEERRTKVIRALQQEGDADAKAIAALMLERRARA
jgi:transcriptional regulator